MSTMNILALPYDIIFKILYSIEADLYKESLVMDFNDKKGQLVRLNNRHVTSAGGYFMSTLVLNY